MITAALVALVACVAIAVAFLLLARAGTPRRMFIRLSWIPSTALLLEYLFSESLARALSYLSILIPLLTCVASLVFTLIGTTLMASERQHGERHVDLLWATIIASIPGALLAGYLVFALVISVIHRGA